MKTAKSKPKIKRRKVTLFFECPEADEVSLVGDFNNWNRKKHPMKVNGDGMWSKTVMLPSGTYEYKFMVDNQWREEPHSDDVCQNSFGTSNNILVVK